MSDDFAPTMTDKYYDKVHELVAAKEAIARLTRELSEAQRTIRSRQHLHTGQRDPPECVRTLGFWPECGCGECYAIHLLDEQMGLLSEARAEVEQYRKAWLSIFIDDLPAKPDGAQTK